MANMISDEWVKVDDITGDARPSLSNIEAAARVLKVQPSEIFSLVASDVLNGEAGSSENFLEELLEWIVFAEPIERTRVLGGYAIHQKMLLEDAQTQLDEGAFPPRRMKIPLGSRLYTSIPTIVLA
jgi:hypothetical protein